MVSFSEGKRHIAWMMCFSIHESTAIFDDQHNIEPSSG